MSAHVVFEVTLGREHPISKCRSCGALIWWVKTAKGKNMPLSMRTKEEREGKVFAACHFSDCEHAASHRKEPSP